MSANSIDNEEIGVFLSQLRNYVETQRTYLRQSCYWVATGNGIGSLNDKSLLSRYGTDYSSTRAPFTIDDTTGTHTASKWQLVKTIDYIGYQNCETDEWEGSETERFLTMVRYELIRASPDYDKAYWGIKL